MNKFLLGTTALISAAAFSAPAFAAEKIQLELRGYHVGGISYTNVDTDYWYDYTDGIGGSGSSTGPGDYNEINFGSDSEVHFMGSTTLDNGLEVSFRAELELENDSDAFGGEGSSDLIDEVYIQFDGGAGRLQFGQNDGAMYQQHIAAPNAFVGHGVNQPDVRMDPFAPIVGYMLDINTYGMMSGDDIKITYFTPSMGGLQLGASYTPNPCKNDAGYAGCVYSSYGRNALEISGAWTMDSDDMHLGVSAGYATSDGDIFGDPSEWTVGAEIGFVGLTFGGSYRDADYAGIANYEETHWDLGVSYETGPWEFSVTRGNAEASGSFISSWDEETKSWIGGVTYMYGPGMQFGFGFQTIDSSEDSAWFCGEGSCYNGNNMDGSSFFLENVISF